MTTTLKIIGMHCASCKVLIEDVCGDIPSVTSCTVDIATGIATIEHEPTVSPETIRHEIESLGDYKTEIV